MAGYQKGVITREGGSKNRTKSTENVIKTATCIEREMSRERHSYYR